MGRIDFAARRKTVDVTIEELARDGVPEVITLRALSVAQLQSLPDGDPLNGLRLLSWAIVDKETKKRIYGDKEEDLNELKEMSVTVSQLLIEALNDLHGVGKKAIEETVKN